MTSAWRERSAELVDASSSTPQYVRERLGALVADEDLTRYIL
ncbi:MAG TPA: hypothetical protein VFQ65_16830 [Kofleriaceae bacterium]|nr:hypothetical protein [Kofleriaceae bacterium]